MLREIRGACNSKNGRQTQGRHRETKGTGSCKIQSTEEDGTGIAELWREGAERGTQEDNRISGHAEERQEGATTQEGPPQRAE